MSFRSLIDTKNEIEAYINCQYISASEACWKLLGFDMQYRSVAVERLLIHLELCNRVFFSGNESAARMTERTTASMSKFIA